MASDFASAMGGNIPCGSSTAKRRVVNGLTRYINNTMIRTAPMRLYRVMNGSTELDQWPLTRSIVCQHPEKGETYIHPAIDPTYGIRAYTYNMLNATRDYFDYGGVPEGGLYVSQGYSTIGQNCVIAACNGPARNWQYIWTMPAQLPNSYIAGRQHSTVGDKISVVNNVGRIDTGYSSRIATTNTNNTFPFYLVKPHTFESNVFSGRTMASIGPSMFAVVSCINCTPLGIMNSIITTSQNPLSTAPILSLNDDMQLRMEVYDVVGGLGGWMYYNFYRNSQSGCRVVQKIREVGGNAIYFLWAPPRIVSISASDSSYYIVPAPTVQCEVKTGVSSGSTINCRIIQFGVEFNV